jgi:type II secretory pathway predicted ATPase ExeA
MIKPVVTALNMYPVNEAVTVPLRHRLDDAGVLHPDAVMQSAAEGMLQELQRIQLALRPLRELDLVATS